MTIPGQLLIQRQIIFSDVNTERDRQDAKWGPQHHPNGTGSLEQIKHANRTRAITDFRAHNGTVTWKDILEEEFAEAMAESDPALLRKELIETIAVAVAWIEDLDDQG